jgi:hypothetical protein
MVSLSRARLISVKNLHVSLWDLEAEQAEELIIIPQFANEPLHIKNALIFMT